MLHHALFVVIPALIFSCSIFGDEIEENIALLDASEFAVRVRATQFILQADPERAIPRLKKLIQETPSPEARDRAENLLERLSPTLDGIAVIRSLYRAMVSAENVRQLTEVIDRISNGFDAVAMKNHGDLKGEALKALSAKQSRLGTMQFNRSERNEESAKFLRDIDLKERKILFGFTQLFVNSLRGFVDDKEFFNPDIEKAKMFLDKVDCNTPSLSLDEFLRQHNLDRMQTGKHIPFTYKKQKFSLLVDAYGNFGVRFGESESPMTIPALSQLDETPGITTTLRAKNLFPKFARLPDGTEIRSLNLPDLPLELLQGSFIEPRSPYYRDFIARRAGTLRYQNLSAPLVFYVDQLSEIEKFKKMKIRELVTWQVPIPSFLTRNKERLKHP